MSNHEHIESFKTIPCPPPTHKRFRNLTGQRFGRLLVQAFYGKQIRSDGHTRMYFTCLCDCGTVSVVRSASLISGATTSCDCYRVEQASKINAIKNRTHGKYGTTVYHVWNGMIQRCYNPNGKSYKRYGGRGITVCDRWKKSFENFYSDMGDPSAGLTLERRDNNLGYSPENCLWASRTAQARNRRSNRLITHSGMTMCVAAWEEHLGLTPSIIIQRLDVLGWSVERAITEPVGSYRCNPN